MKNKTLLTLIGVAAFALATMAQPAPEPFEPPTPELYQAGEFTLDLGVLHTKPVERFSDAFDRPLRGGDEGMLFGAKYWPSLYVGVGADFHALWTHDYTPRGKVGPLIRDFNGSVYVRYPIGPVAPYAYGGLGRDYVLDEYTTHAGIGVEWRFKGNFGLFTEARYVSTFHNERDQFQLRAGFSARGLFK